MIIQYFSIIEKFLSKPKYCVAFAHHFTGFLDNYNLSVCLDHNNEFDPELGLSIMLKDDKNSYVDSLSASLIDEQEKKIVEILNQCYFNKRFNFDSLIKLLQAELSFIKSKIDNDTVSRDLVTKFISEFSASIDQHTVVLNKIEQVQKFRFDIDLEIKHREIKYIQSFVDDLATMNFFDDADKEKVTNLLTGNEITGRINWTGEAKQFVYIFKKLKDISVYKTELNKNMWHRLISIFKLKGGEFKGNNLSAYANPKKDPIPELDKVCDYLKRMIDTDNSR